MAMVLIGKNWEKIAGSSVSFYPKKKFKKWKKKFRNPRKSEQRTLSHFYRKYKTLKDIKLRILLLKEYSDKCLKKRTKKSLVARRYKFDRSKFNREDIKMDKCFCCNSNPEVRHHIIALKNGGDNHGKNIVPLCKPCHAEIHEWLKPIPVDCLTKEFKRVV